MRLSWKFYTYIKWISLNWNLQNNLILILPDLILITILYFKISLFFLELSEFNCFCLFLKLKIFLNKTKIDRIGFDMQWKGAMSSAFVNQLNWSLASLQASFVLTNFKLSYWFDISHPILYYFLLPRVKRMQFSVDN